MHLLQTRIMRVLAHLQKGETRVQRDVASVKETLLTTTGLEHLAGVSDCMTHLTTQSIDCPGRYCARGQSVLASIVVQYPI